MVRPDGFGLAGTCAGSGGSPRPGKRDFWCLMVAVVNHGWIHFNSRCYLGWLCFLAWKVKGVFVTLSTKAVFNQFSAQI